MPELTPIGPDVPELENAADDDDDIDIAELEQKLREKVSLMKDSALQCLPKIRILTSNLFVPVSRRRATCCPGGGFAYLVFVAVPVQASK